MFGPFGPFAVGETQKNSQWAKPKEFVVGETRIRTYADPLLDDSKIVNLPCS